MTTHVLGGTGRGNTILSSMERYDASSEQWGTAAAMLSERKLFGACVVGGKIYIYGGKNAGGQTLSSVEKYSPSSDTWTAVAPMPGPTQMLITLSSLSGRPCMRLLVQQ